ncbi:MAG: T9SS type A sorting domain-containing protein [Bacteroidales bacterium]|nr:T9SS type A sorting domain-containing protein [Bacteroidales bacterium]
MKKIMVLTVLIAWAVLSTTAQTTLTLAGWTFPTGIDTVDIYPDICIPENTNKYLSSEDTTAWPSTNLRDVYFTAGETTFAATADGWENGKESKLWSIKIKAEGYSDLMVSSKLSSDAVNPGPRDWKIQARLSGGDWVDIPGGTVTCAGDWTTGTVVNLALPPDFNNPSSSLYIRWIMTSDTSIAGALVESTGISLIEDVIITGVTSAGITETLFGNAFDIYPNPCSNGIINISDNRGDITALHLYNIHGQNAGIFYLKGSGKVSVDQLETGIYLVRPGNRQGDLGAPVKLVID